MGCAQGMPKILTFADQYGFEIHNAADDVNDDHDSDYDPEDDGLSYSSDILPLTVLPLMMILTMATISLSPFWA